MQLGCLTDTLFQEGCFEFMKIKFINADRETEVEAEEGRSLLDIALIARVDPPYSCLEGSCGTCRAFIEVGETTEDSSESRVVRTCQAIPRSDFIVVNYDKTEAE